MYLGMNEASVAIIIIIIIITDEETPRSRNEIHKSYLLRSKS
jgi:hypothetical protein